MSTGETRRSWIAPALAVTVLAAVVVAFRGTIVSLILEPLAWLLWAGWRLLASVDQQIWWVLVALACAVPVIRLFNSQLRLHDVDRPPEAWESSPGGRVEHWISRAARLAESEAGRRALRADLESLAASVGETTRMSLPPDLTRERAPARQASLATPPHSLAERAAAELVGLLPGYRRRADLQAIERILNWMEGALEIRHDEHWR